MFRTRIALICAVTVLAGCLILPAAGAEMDAGSVYCFSAEDFSAREDMVGICITDLPETMAGNLTLGSRILRCETAPLCALSAVMYAAAEF